MYRYIFKRLLIMIPVLLCVSFIVFGLMALAPGDPASIILGGTAEQEQIDKLNHEFGYDRPFIIRYADFLKNLVINLDFGTSYRTKQPVMEEISKRAPISISLALFGVTCAAFVGIPIGVLSAVKQYSLLDTIPTVMALFLGAIPPFWLGMLLIYFCSYKAGWMPSFGIDSWINYVLPTASIGIIYAAQQMRYTRSSMLETIRQDYVRTARAKGAAERTVIWKHALKNALLPTITVIGSNFGALIGGAIIVESLFSIPGLGTLTITGINNRDVPQVVASTLVLATIYCIVLLLVDILYAVIDPRVKAKYTK